MKVKTGIFWVIEGKILLKQVEVEVAEKKQFTDCPYSHFAFWQSVTKGQYPDADFATYPRGRLMYASIHNKHILYADKCINTQQRSEIMKQFGLQERDCIVAYDDHYKCDKCLKETKPIALGFVNNDKTLSVCTLDENDKIVYTDTFDTSQLEHLISILEEHGNYDFITDTISLGVYEMKQLTKMRAVFEKAGHKVKSSFCVIAHYNRYCDFLPYDSLTAPRDIYELVALYKFVKQAAAKTSFTEQEYENIVQNSIRRIGSCLTAKSGIAENLARLYKAQETDCGGGYAKVVAALFDAFYESEQGKRPDEALELNRILQEAISISGDKAMFENISYDIDKFFAKYGVDKMRIYMLPSKNGKSSFEVAYKGTCILVQTGASSLKIEGEQPLSRPHYMFTNYSAVICTDACLNDEITEQAYECPVYEFANCDECRPFNTGGKHVVRVTPFVAQDGTLVFSFNCGDASVLYLSKNTHDSKEYKAFCKDSNSIVIGNHADNRLPLAQNRAFAYACDNKTITIRVLNAENYGSANEKVFDASAVANISQYLTANRCKDLGTTMTNLYCANYGQLPKGMHASLVRNNVKCIYVDSLLNHVSGFTTNTPQKAKNIDELVACFRLAQKYKMKQSYSERELQQTLTDSLLLLANKDDLHLGRLTNNVLRLLKYDKTKFDRLIAAYYDDFYTMDEEKRLADANCFSVILRSVIAREGKEALATIERDFDDFFDKYYRYTLRYKVLRGENELTGNLIEITNGVKTLLVECGCNLANPSGKEEEIEKYVRQKSYSAVIVSHGHLDHIGLIGNIKDTPIFMGELTEKLYRLTDKNSANLSIANYVDGEYFYVGNKISGIKVTPFLCDHSAPDSYMLLFEYDGKNILYTGDFRSHGRKNYDKLLEKLPHKVDALIVEGTNNSQSGECNTISEAQIQRRFSTLLREADKPLFVLVPTTNIDRIVSVYKAATKQHRILLIDKEQARVLEAVGGNVPRPTTFNNVKVYYPLPIRKKDFEKFLDVRAQSLGITDIAKRNDYVMLIRPSCLSYLKKLSSKTQAGLNGATLVYSMWSGYQSEEPMKTFLDELAKLGVKIVMLHTSGHAEPKAIAELIAQVNPAEIVKVHTPK